MTTDTATATRQPRDNGFLLGFMTATLVGAAVAICFAPRSSGFGRQVKEAMKSLGDLGEEVGNAKRSAVAEIKKHVST